MRPLLAIAAAPLLLGTLSGCNDACERRCAPSGEFYTDCAGALEEAGVVLRCYDADVEALDDGSLDPADARACTDARDYALSCLHATRARGRALNNEENDARMKECAERDPWFRAVEAGDCEAAIDAWLVERGG